MVDLFADIIPGNSAAGFALGQRFSEEDFGPITRWNVGKGTLMEVTASTEGWLRVDVAQISFEATGGHILHYHRGAVDLHYSSAGILYSITVCSGYLGKYAEEIGVGDRVDSVLRHAQLWYDSGDELLYPAIESGVQGIAFLGTSRPLDEDQDQLIFGIVVYDWDLMRP